MYIIKQVLDVTIIRMWNKSCKGECLFTIHFEIICKIVYIYILANWKHRATSCKSSWGVTRFPQGLLSVFQKLRLKSSLQKYKYSVCTGELFLGSRKVRQTPE